MGISAALSLQLESYNIVDTSIEANVLNEEELDGSILFFGRGNMTVVEVMIAAIALLAMHVEYTTSNHESDIRCDI